MAEFASIGYVYLSFVRPHIAHPLEKQGRTHPPLFAQEEAAEWPRVRNPGWISKTSGIPPFRFYDKQSRIELSPVEIRYPAINTRYPWE